MLSSIYIYFSDLLSLLAGEVEDSFDGLDSDDLLSDAGFESVAGLESEGLDSPPVLVL